MSRGGAPLCINVCELSEIDGNYYLVSSEGRLALYDGSLSFCDKVVKCVEQSDYTLTGTYDFSNSTTEFNADSIDIEANSYTPVGAWDFSGADVYGLDLGIFDCDDTKNCLEAGDFSLAGTWIFNNATLEGLGVLGCAGMVECVEDGAFVLEGLWDFSNAYVSGMEPSTGPQTFGCSAVENCIEQGNFSLTGTYDFTNATVNGIFDCDVIKTCVEEGIVVTETDPGFENATVTFPTPIENKGESLRSMGFFTSEGESNLYGVMEQEELNLQTLDFDLQDPKGVFFKPDGTKFYVIAEYFPENREHAVFQFETSNSWDIDPSPVSYVGDRFLTKDASNNPVYGNELMFSDDGTKLYISDRSNNLYQYTLSTAWEVTTASLYGSYDLDNVDSNVDADGFYIADNGTKLYAAHLYGRIYQYILSTPRDITTANYDNKELVIDQNVVGFGRYEIIIDGTGENLYVFNLGSGLGLGHKFTLSTARDLSTASYGYQFYSYDNSFQGGMDVGKGGFHYIIPEGLMFIVGERDDNNESILWKTDAGGYGTKTIPYWYDIKENYNAIRFKLFIHDIKDGQGTNIRFPRTGLVSEGYAIKSDRTITDWGDTDNSNTEFFCTYYGEDGPETFNDRVLHAVTQYNDGGTWHDLEFKITMKDTTNVGQVGSVEVNIESQNPNQGVTDTDQVFTIVAEPYYDVGFEAVNYQ